MALPQERAEEEATYCSEEHSPVVTGRRIFVGIMDNNTLLIIIVVVLLLGGGGFFFRGRR